MGCGSSAPVPPPTSTPSNDGGPGGEHQRHTGQGTLGLKRYVYGCNYAYLLEEESRNIDNDLERAKLDEGGKIKMLLLGAGESGKSTIFKQMRLLYGTERSDCAVQS